MDMPSPSPHLISSDSPAARDASDPLAPYRHRFLLPVDAYGQPSVYLCGQSLGLQPKAVHSYVEAELQDWAKLGVEGHFGARHAWLSYHELLTDQTARLVGGNALEVVVMNSLTVNLHLMCVSFYRPTAERYRILIEADAFPSDRYAVMSQVAWHGLDPTDAVLEWSPAAGDSLLDTNTLAALLERWGESIALILLGGVNYYSGQALPMATITDLGHAHGCVVGFDLAHAIGNLPLALHEWDVDFAVWCSYKYLNAGPGSVAGCFVHERHIRRTDLPRLAGWWGHNKATRFAMPDTFDPIPGAEGWQLSNPPILPLAALRAALDIFDEVGMDRLRAKSLQLTAYLESILQQHRDAITIITPRDPQQRGAQLSIRLAHHGRALFEWLTQGGVICDWREPDVIRLAPVPLYNQFSEVERFGHHLTAALQALC